MEFIINFFEYYVSGVWYVVYVVFFVIIGFSLIGMVGERETNRKLAEAEAKKEEKMKEEYKKAHDLIEKQAQTYSVDMTLDPEAIRSINAVPLADDEKNIQKESIDSGAETSNGSITSVDSSGSIVDNTSEDAIKANDVPSVLIIDEVEKSDT